MEEENKRDSKTELATFALGWFWDPEATYGCAKGVIRTKVGYTGGTTINPDYGNIGDHTETVQIEYDPSKTTYEKLLQLFWDNHSPTYKSSLQYKSGIWFHNKEQEIAALKSKEFEETKTKKKMYTVIEPASIFTNAEGYHQKFKLTRHTEITDALQLSEDEMIESSVASRLNGYLGGNGTVEDLMQEIGSFGLPSTCKEYLIDAMDKKSSW